MNPKIEFIIDPSCSAAFNMAADLYLLSRCGNSSTLFVRFTKWEPPCITLGYMQRADDILNMPALRKSGITWIRRPTGGRAVLHWRDITYSCVFPVTIDSMGESINKTYGIISRCLIKGLKECGIEAEMLESSAEIKKTRNEAALPCFLAPNRNEIMVRGKKLIGSAQKRTTRGVLQHGSMPLTGSFRRLPLYCKMNRAEQIRRQKLLKEKCTCVEECLDYFTDEGIIKNLIHGFVQSISLTYEIREWSQEEKREILSISNSEIFKHKWLV